MPTATEFDYVIHIPAEVKGAHADIRAILARVLQDTDRYDWSKEHRVFAINVEGLPEAVGGIYGLLMEGRFFEKGIDFKPTTNWPTAVVVDRATGTAAVDPNAAPVVTPSTPPGALALTAILVDEDGEIEVGNAHTAPDAEPADEPYIDTTAPLSPIARVEENRAALRPVLQGACTLSLHAEDGTRREVIVAPTRDRHWIATLVERTTGKEIADADHLYRLHAKLLALYTPESDEPRSAVI